jgi:hypothetical protein
MSSVFNLFNDPGSKRLSQLLTFFLAFALLPPVLHAQNQDQGNRPNKVNDPTGAWLIRNDAEGSGFVLTVFHRGGTLTGDFQGESAFVPGASPPLNVIETPESGVWGKTGAKTFAVTILTIEYQSTLPTVPLFQFDKLQFTGFLYESGDRMEITDILITFFDQNGQLKGQPVKIPTKAHGVRIPLEVLPSTSTTLPIPTP